MVRNIFNKTNTIYNIGYINWQNRIIFKALLFNPIILNTFNYYQGHRGNKTLFLTKIDFSFYIKALSTNYKSVFTELKILFNFWDIVFL